MKARWLHAQISCFAHPLFVTASALSRSAPQKRPVCRCQDGGLQGSLSPSPGPGPQPLTLHGDQDSSAGGAELGPSLQEAAVGKEQHGDRRWPISPCGQCHLCNVLAGQVQDAKGRLAASVHRGQFTGDHSSISCVRPAWDTGEGSSVHFSPEDHQVPPSHMLRSSPATRTQPGTWANASTPGPTRPLAGLQGEGWRGTCGRLRQQYVTKTQVAGLGSRGHGPLGEMGTQGGPWPIVKESGKGSWR